MVFMEDIDKKYSSKITTYIKSIDEEKEKYNSRIRELEDELLQKEKLNNKQTAIITNYKRNCVEYQNKNEELLYAIKNI